MAKVRLAGTVTDEKDPNRLSRAMLLYELFSKGWDIENANGDQRISLSNIEGKIIDADAFVFTPGATLEDLFKAVSIFVGYQTHDRNLANKPTVLMNSDGSWDSLYGLLEHLNAMGTVKQNSRDHLLEAHSVGQVFQLLQNAMMNGIPEPEPVRVGDVAGPSFETPLPEGHKGNVCVFCSASIEKQEYLQEGYDLGKELADHKLGCISGAGKSGIMGEVVRGSVEAGGWTGGSNVPHIIELEGLPDGLSSFWLKPDIYTRMGIMIERSDAFVIFPGGAGTVQEMLALMIFKHQDSKGMKGKPVILYNRLDEGGLRFWDPLIHLLGEWCSDCEFAVVEEFAEILPKIRQMIA